MWWWLLGCLVIPLQERSVLGMRNDLLEATTMLTLKASISHRYQTIGREAKGSNFCNVLLEALEIFLCSESLAFRVNFNSISRFLFLNLKSCVHEVLENFQKKPVDIMSLGIKMVKGKLISILNSAWSEPM